MPRANKIHKSLNIRQLTMGIDKKIGTFYMLMWVMMVFYLGSLWVIPLGYVVLKLLQLFWKREPDIRDIYFKAIALDNIYDPWPHATQRMNVRPQGYRKGMLC